MRYHKFDLVISLNRLSDIRKKRFIVKRHPIDMKHVSRYLSIKMSIATLIHKMYSISYFGILVDLLTFCLCLSGHENKWIGYMYLDMPCAVHI